MQPSDLVLRFISSIGGPREALYYLSLFRSERPEAFAMIAASAAVMGEAMGALVVDLRFLAQLGLTPVIVLGHRDPARARALAEQLAQRLRPDVSSTIVDRPDSPGQIRSAARAGTVALVLLPEDSGAAGHGADALAELAAALGTRKVVFVDRQSGLQPKHGPVPSLVNITTEYEALRAALPDDQAALLGRIQRLIHTVPHRFTVAVTSPLDLLRELFTTSGAGTLIRRGSVVSRHGDYAAVDRDRVRRLLESAFDKPLSDDFFARPIASLYVADDVRGLAIINQTVHGSYLSKFAVDRQAQGEGVGRDLWRALVADCPMLLWRSRRDNPVAAWYQQQCDGMMRTARWLIFWRGLDVDRIAEAIRYADAAPPDFGAPA